MRTIPDQVTNRGDYENAIARMDVVRSAVCRLDEKIFDSRDISLLLQHIFRQVSNRTTQLRWKCKYNDDAARRCGLLVFLAADLQNFVEWVVL